jgi:hypothetical protein
VEPNAPQDFTNCPDWGKGGQFVYDTATKTRTRVDSQPGDIADTANVSADLDVAQAPSTTQTKKERSRA